jgi:hypothetical protein
MANVDLHYTLGDVAASGATPLELIIANMRFFYEKARWHALLYRRDNPTRLHGHGGAMISEQHKQRICERDTVSDVDGVLRDGGTTRTLIGFLDPQKSANLYLVVFITRFLAPEIKSNFTHFHASCADSIRISCCFS